jgi:hypothetical protein
VDVSQTVVARFECGDSALDELLRLSGFRLELFIGFQVHDVGERLDRYVEHVGQDSQLVEGGITNPFFVPAELRVVDLAALRSSPLLNAPQGVAVAAAQLSKIAAQPHAPFQVRLCL